MFPASTTRIKLSKITAADLDSLVELDADPAVMRHISGGRPSTHDDYLGPEGFLARMCAFEDVPEGYFAARVVGEFAGWFHLRPSIFDPEVPELGYRLARRFWSRGLATEGSLALCAWAFEDLGAPVVDACTVAENAASIAVMKKCGMARIGAMQHPRADLLVEHYQVDRSTFLLL